MKRARCLHFAWTPLFVAACAGAAQQPAGRAPDPARFPHSRELFEILAMEPGAVAFDSLEAYEERIVLELTDTLADIVEDTTVQPLLRANALLLIGRRHRPVDYILLRPLLHERDERIRLALVMASRHYLGETPDAVLALLRDAIHDASPAVQARVLEVAADRDPAMLRAYLETSPPTELGTIARGLVAVAEERGAALEPAPDGRLERVGPGGQRLTWQPLQAWGDYAIGRLLLASPDGTPVVLGDSIEVARNVVPAFFSADGRWLVYEKGRTIHVREVAAGADRTVGPGIAPRPLPFTDDFVYARESPEATTRMPTGARIQYQLVRGSFVPAAPPVYEVVGVLAVNASYDRAGGASPARWVRVVEIDGSFRLTGEGADAVALPGPFDAKAPS